MPSFWPPTLSHTAFAFPSLRVWLCVCGLLLMLSCSLFVNFPFIFFPSHLAVCPYFCQFPSASLCVALSNSPSLTCHALASRLLHWQGLHEPLQVWKRLKSWPLCWGTGLVHHQHGHQCKANLIFEIIRPPPSQLLVVSWCWNKQALIDHHQNVQI